MHRFVVTAVVVALAVSASAQWAADTQVHFERADGTEVVVASQAEEARGVIVEFVAPPAATAAKIAGKAAFDYQAGFTRFRNDLVTIASKKAIDAQIRQEYS